MTFTNLTRANEIGANSYLLEINECRVVFDAGLHPREEGSRATPDFVPLRGKKVDAIFVSHAHLDHIGSLPLIMREQPEARVFMSESTYHLADPLLRNSISVMKKRTEKQSISNALLYTNSELDQVAKKWQACRLHKPWSLQGHMSTSSQNEPVFEMYNSGHILGSVGISLRTSQERILYSGDVNFTDQSISCRAAFPEQEIDVLIIETTRGSTEVGGNFSREQELQRLAQKIGAVFNRGGAVLIPVFALGKTQEALSALYKMMCEGAIPESPIYIGGLSWKMTELYDKLAHRHPRFDSDLNLLKTVSPKLINGRTIQHLRPKRGQIYLLSSGMMSKHTLSNILGQRFLSEKRHGLFFIGYTDPDSPAGKLREAHTRNDSIELDAELGSQPILCEVDYFDLTAHAQREDILAYILRVKPRHVVLVHGDLPALEWFQAQIKSHNPKIRVTIPPSGQPISL